MPTSSVDTDASSKEPREGLASPGRDADGARARHAQDPASCEKRFQQRRTERAAEVRPSLGQIDAGARESALRPAHRSEVDVERGELFLSQPRDAEIPSFGDQPA